MNYLKNIFLRLALIISLPISSFSQTASSILTDEAAAYQALENDFKTHEVSKTQLQLFQKKSTQKVEDFLSVSELLMKNDLDAKFKKQLIEQGLKSFSSPTDSLFYFQKNKLKSISAQDLLDTPKEIKSIFPSSEFSNFELSESLFSDKKYSWKVSFHFSQNDILKNSFTANCILVKKEKLFGDVKKEVWQVLIKEIREQKIKGK